MAKFRFRSGRACPFCMLVRLRIKLGLKRWCSPPVLLACMLVLVLVLLGFPASK